MLSKTVKIIVGFIILTAFWGCSQSRNVFMGESQLDKNWGRSYETAKHNQILNPDAGKQTAPVEGMQGPAAERIMNGYIKGGEANQQDPTEFGVVTIKR